MKNKPRPHHDRLKRLVLLYGKAERRAAKRLWTSDGDFAEYQIKNDRTLKILGALFREIYKL